MRAIRVVLIAAIVSGAALAHGDERSESERADADSLRGSERGVRGGRRPTRWDAATIFFGAHPIHPAAGRGFCLEDGAHVHDYAPVDPSTFVFRDGLWIFVGDPLAWGFGGEAYPFDPGHGLPDWIGGGICVIVGPHHHLFPPPDGVPPVVYPYIVPFFVPWHPGWGPPVAPVAPRPPYPPPSVVRRRPPTPPPPLRPTYRGGVGRSPPAVARPPTGRPHYPLTQPPPPARRIDPRRP